MVAHQFTTKLKNVQTDWGGEFRNLALFFSSLGIIHRQSCPHTSEQNGFVERRNRHVVETGLTLLAQSCIPQHHGTVLPTTITEPTSFSVANNSSEWRQAMKEEYDDLVKNGTWTLVHRASNTNVVDLMRLSLDFNKKFYNSLGRVPNRCSSIIGKTRVDVIRYLGEIVRNWLDLPQLAIVLQKAKQIQDFGPTSGIRASRGTLTSYHEDASENGTATNKPKQQQQLIPTTTTISNIKLPILKKGRYIWAMEMEHYLEYIDNDVWKIEKGKGRLEPIYYMAIPKEHLRRFHGMDDLEAHGAEVSTKDANHKFLRSLPLAWSNLAMTMRTKPDVDTLSIDDLYNNLRVFEQELTIQLNTVRQNVNSVRPNVNTGRANVNTVRANVNSVRQNVNSVRQTRSYHLRTWRTEVYLIVDAQGTMICNKDPPYEFKECKGDLLPFGGRKGYKAGKGRIRVGTSEVTNSADTLPTPNVNASEEEDAAEELIVMATAVKHTAAKVGPRINTPEILAFRKELDELAQKYLREVPKNKATSTNSVNSGSGQDNPQPANQDDSDMAELTIFNKPQKGIFDEASYDDEGAHALESISKAAKEHREAMITEWVRLTRLNIVIKKDTKDIIFQMSSMGELKFLPLDYKSAKDIYGIFYFSRQVTPKTSHLNAVKRIFKYLKGKPNLGLWYPKESSFDLEAYSDSDYDGANLDRKSTTGGCQFLGSRLISWQCKKQTIVATSTTEAEYVLLQIASGFAEIVDFLKGSHIRSSRSTRTPSQPYESSTVPPPPTSQPAPIESTTIPPTPVTEPTSEPSSPSTAPEHETMEHPFEQPSAPETT
ncbi:uncharacterized mitochondrial protein-like protein [Tanacetum coccineum]